MIDRTPLSYPPDITVQSPSVRILLTDSDQLRAVYELPPLEEIILIQRMAHGKLSIDETLQNYYSESKEAYYLEYLRLSKKMGKFEESSTYLNHLAMLLENAGRLEEAHEHAGRAALKSGNPYLLSRHAINLLKRKSETEALDILADLSAKGDIFATLNLSLAYLYQRDFAKAVQTVSNAVEYDPEDYHARLLRGSLHLVRGEIEPSIRDLRVAIESNPDSAVAHANIALAFISHGRTKEAIRHAQQSAALNPLDQHVVALLADLYLYTKDYEQAITLISGFLNYDQKQAVLWDRLAKAYFHLGKFEKSLSTLRNEASVSNTAAVWNNMAIVEAAIGDHQKAIQYYSQAWAMTSEANVSEKVAFNYFRFLRRQGLTAAILPLSDTIIERFLGAKSPCTPEAVEIVMSHMLSLYENNQKEKAITLGEDYVLLHQEECLSLLNMMNFLIYHFSMVDKNEKKALHYARYAKEVLGKRSALSPVVRLRVLNNIAYALLEFGQTDAAGEVIREAEGKGSDDIFLTATKGFLLFRQGNLREGSEHYRRAQNLAASGELKALLVQKQHLEQGRYLLRQGNIREAKTELIECIKQKGGSELFVSEAKKELEL
jgi:tetratricopeptide (TPR) repeat protein